jgi:nucleoside-diphosphate-sugar epimerase
MFVAGATGAVGKYLVPLLIQRDHEVVALTRSAEKAKLLEAIGARVVVGDALDAAAIGAAVAAAKPDAVVHQMTALTGIGANLKQLDEAFAPTNRLRTDGLDHLLAASRAAGVRRFIAQSFTGWPYARTGGPVKTEADPLDSNPPPHFEKTLAAIRYLEETLAGCRDLDALVLRYGFFYGPGTSIAADGEIVAALRQRKLPIVGDGAGIWSFTHVADAASATVAALDRGSPGLYNIVDDEPAPVVDWLPSLAAAVDAEPPRHVPAWLAKPLIGAGGVTMMTEIRGASNAKAKRDLDWRPEYASWRDGFVRGLGFATPPES